MRQRRRKGHQEEEKCYQNPLIMLAMALDCEHLNMFDDYYKEPPKEDKVVDYSEPQCEFFRFGILY